MATQVVEPCLSHDLFHVYILPHILSEHLHDLLVAPEVPDWHAFYTLPLVSLAFHDTCRVLYAKIFGRESGSDIDDVLTFTQSLWYQAKEPSQGSQLLTQYTYRELMSGNSLIRVYVCTALARSFFVLDVLHPITQQGREKNLGGHHEAPGGLEEEYLASTHDNIETQVGARVRDDLMHRVYLPLTCAITLCDSVRPESLASIAANYLAELVPAYSTAPVLLKYAHDLESYITRVHRVDMETWGNWAVQTLDLIEATKHLLGQIYEMGTLVRSFSRVSTIPREVLEATNIIKAVREVKRASWGTHTSEIRARASSLLQGWGATE